MTWLIVNGDARHLPIRSGSVHCVVTSPPFLGLRDYGVDGQIGLEPTPEDFIAELVAVFREVRRCLRDDGVAWVELGDSYAANRAYQVPDSKHTDVGNNGAMRVPAGLKPKDLCGIPWRVALALQSDGWWLRSDCIWARPNPMPESVTDRPTKSHSYVFLLSKSASYYYDADAVREPHSDPSRGRGERESSNPHSGRLDDPSGKQQAAFTVAVRQYNPLGRNLRSVWTIPTYAFPGAHFATFAPALAERCIKAGTSERGCCATCGAPWERVIEIARDGECCTITRLSETARGGKHGQRLGERIRDVRATTGWRPTCDHGGEPVPCVTLDPFSGAGTVPLVAHRLGRRGIGVELSPVYCAMARERCRRETITEALPPRKPQSGDNGPLFGAP